VSPAALLLPCLWVQSVPPVVPPRDNVLIVIADDVGVDMIGVYGEGAAPPPTPVIDALASRGVLFRNAWSNPVCSPTRASLLTGRHAFRTGVGHIVDAVPDNPALSLDEITLPEMLALGTDGAYASAAFGKWHLGSAAVGGALAPNLAGFDHFAGALANFHGAETYSSWTRVVDGAAEQTTKYATTDTVDSALAWLADAPEPWFAYVAFNSAHFPYHAPPEALHTIDLSQAGPPAQDPGPYYRAMVQAMDTELGRLLDGLGPAVTERTTIVFLGDNGSPGDVSTPPFPASHAKGTLFEGGVNVPFIVSGPLVANAGRECAALVGVTDVYATVADAAQVDLGAVLPGVVLDSLSLAPYLADPLAPSGRTTVFSEYFHPNGQPSAAPALGQAKPAAWLCQADIGGASPVGPVLSVCGQPLYGGNSATLALTGAMPFVPAFLYSATQPAPFPVAGGVLVPSVPDSIQAFVTDAAGGHTATIVGGIGDVTVYFQAIVSGPAPGPAFILSNAVQVQKHGTDFKAVRNHRYKLTMNAHTGEQHLYDLVRDPFEGVDLLGGGPLPPEVKFHHKALVAALRALLGPAARPGVLVDAGLDP
jgi:arylsulfatase A-like enzyme